MAATTEQLEANKKLARDYIDQVFNQHNPAKAADFVTGDVVWHGGGLGDIAGPDNLAGLLGSFIGALPDLYAAEQDIIAENDLVVVRLVITATVRGSLQCPTSLSRPRRAQRRRVGRGRPISFSAMAGSLPAIPPGRRQPRSPYSAGASLPSATRPAAFQRHQLELRAESFMIVKTLIRYSNNAAKLAGRGQGRRLRVRRGLVDRPPHWGDHAGVPRTGRPALVARRTRRRHGKLDDGRARG